MHAPLTRTAKVWRVRILTTTWMSYAGYYFCRKNYFIVKNDLAKLFEVDNFALAQIFTVYLVAYMLGQFATAYLGRKLAARVLLLGGMGLTAGCNVIFGFNALMGPAGYYPMMIFMIVNGFAQATGWAGNVAVLGNWLSRTERGKVMALWATSYQLGSAFAKGFAALMLGWLGVAWSFWGATLIMFAVWLFFYFLQRDKPEDAGLDPIVEEVEIEVPVEKDGLPRAAAAQHAARGGVIFGMPRAVFLSVIFIGTTYFVFKFCRYALDSWGPMMITKRFSVGRTEAGFVSTLFDWVGFLGVLVGGWASDTFFKGRRYQMVVIMTIGMLLSIIAMATFGRGSIWVFGALLALTGFMLMGPDSLLSGAGAVDVGGRDTAIVAAGIINGLGSVGPIFQEQIIGWMSGRYGFQSTFYMLIGVAAAGVLGALYLAQRSRSGQSNL